MSLHHIVRLEHLLDQFYAALRPGGLLALNEFVGPDRFQWTDAQLEISTRGIGSLPLRLRRNRDPVWWKRSLKLWTRKTKRWSPERVARIDPSESVRSSEIPHLITQRFESVRCISYGGAMLALVLNNIVGNFTEASEDVRHLRRLVEEEDRWMRAGRISSDYTVMFACKG